MHDGNFLEICTIICLQEGTLSDTRRVVVLGKILGTQEKKCYTPYMFEPKVAFDDIIGHTCRLFEKSESLIAYDADKILAKCVVAVFDDSISYYVLTALVNCHETD